MKSKEIKRLSILFVSMLLLFVGAMTCVNTIPFARIDNNTQTTNKILHQEGLYYSVPDIQFFRLDNFTNYIMLDLAVSVNEDQPFVSVLRSTSLWGRPEEELDGLIQDIIDCKRAQNCDELEFGNYARYWHGYLIPLRSLLTFTDINGIRIINYCIIFLLFIYCCIKIKKRLSVPILAIFIGTFLLVGLPMIPLSPQLTTCFFITLLACVVLLSFPNTLSNKYIDICFFFAVGGLTSFMDFLTTPILTLGIPLTLALLLHKNENPWRYATTICCSWLAGYALIWISKWCLVAIFTDIPVFADAANAAALRLSSHGEAIRINNPLLRVILSRLALILFLLIYLIVGAFLYLRDKSGYIRSLLVFYVIAAFPLAWYILLYEHSIHHNFFTWRVIAVSLFSFSIFVYLSLKRNSSSNGLIL